MRITGRILVLSAIIITVVSALFCIIGLSTKGWDSGVGLFCSGCYKPTAALSVISFIFLILSIIALVLQMFDILNGVLRYIPILILFIATLFLLATVASYLGRFTTGYSYNLMVVAQFFSYVALAVTAYWLGQSDASSG